MRYGAILGVTQDFLKLYSDLPSNYKEKAIDYVMSEILSHLGDLEIDILLLLATLPDPMDKSLLSRLFARRIDKYLHNLRKLGLIVETSGGVTVPGFLKGILSNPQGVSVIISILIQELMNGGWEEKLRAMRYSLIINYNLIPAKIAM